RARTKLFWIGTAAVVIAVLIAVVWHRADQPARAASPPPAIPVTVATAERRDVPVLLTALGTAQASQTIAIRSQIDGKLQSVNFVEGQEVHQGDTLAVIDPRALQAALD